MSFESQTLHGFVEAKFTASELLRVEGLKETQGEIGFEEALAMQAISDILVARDTFYGQDIITAINRKPGCVYPILHKFELPYRLVTSLLEDRGEASARVGGTRREYQSTTFGRTIFGLFVPANAK